MMLGTQPADLAQRREGIGVAVQTTHAGGNVGAGGVIEANQRDTPLGSELEQARQLLAVGGVHGAGAYREVVAVDRDIAAADADQRGDQGGAVEVGTPVLVQHLRRLIGDAVDALPDRHALLQVLALCCAPLPHGAVASAARRRLSSLQQQP
jgi:hypothetical protein